MTSSCLSFNHCSSHSHSNSHSHSFSHSLSFSHSTRRLAHSPLGIHQAQAQARARAPSSPCGGGRRHLHKENRNWASSSRSRSRIPFLRLCASTQSSSSSLDSSVPVPVDAELQQQRQRDSLLALEDENGEPIYATVIEPFRIKTVEPLYTYTRKQRKDFLRDADYNLFKLSSENVTLDFLTDSGTGAMSANQWGAMMIGDESYAGSPSFVRFEQAVKHLFPFKHVLPTHQGRAAEKVLFSALGGKGRVVPNNTHFDTTRAHVEASGAEALDLIVTFESTSQKHPFKGNMDVDALRSLLEGPRGKDVPCVMLTVTNNSAGGQPVSLENMKLVSELAHAHGKPLIMDACRFAENAFFIQRREPGQRDRSIEDIVRDMASLCDGMTMSAKKDGLANIGGWLAINDDKLAASCREQLILTEGYTTYGGLAGRDLDAIAVGLQEVVQEPYLEYRIRTIDYFGKALIARGIPCVEPLGGHAIYLDASRMLPSMPRKQLPGHSVACALYVEGGIRACEIGTLMFGGAAKNELVRMAIPRRMYTQSHVDYAIEVCERVAALARRGSLPGYKIVEQPPSLRHFSAKLRPFTL